MAVDGQAVNLANSITIARIVTVPVFVFLLLTSDAESLSRWVALAVFVAAISTDGLDGMVARRTDTVTNLGKILDPIADKALIGGALLTLSYLGEIQWWITIVILARELLVTLYRGLVVRRKVIAASLSGKLKTIFQSIAVSVVMAPIEIWIPLWSYLEIGLLYFAVGLTIYSGISFVISARKK